MLKIRKTWLVAGLLAASMPYLAWQVVDDGEAVVAAAPVPAIAALPRPTNIRAIVPAHPEPAVAVATPVDTTGLLQPTHSVDEVLDLLDADIGPTGLPVDRESLAAELRSDPELMQALQDSAGSLGEAP
jgi:hypothetical protein